MSIERECIEAGNLLRTYFSDAGYFNDAPDVIFYAKLFDDSDTYISVSYPIEEMVGLSKHDILDKVLVSWL